MDFVALLVGIGIGGILGWLFANQRKNGPVEGSVSEEVHGLLECQLEESKSEIIRLENNLLDVHGKYQAALKEKELTDQRLKEHKLEIEELQERFKKEFQLLANEILEQKSKNFKEQNEEQLKGILTPLKERIKEFEEKVDKTYSQGSKERHGLQKEIERLQELNVQISQDAINLTNALKGESKTRGDWGEFQLETLLEKSGLVRDVNFHTQTSIRDEEDQLKRPDVVVDLPDSKNIIIDSKVSLSAYEAYFNAETDEERDRAMKNHLNSIYIHIKDLGSKKYDKLYGINSPDYVLMFVPIEPALNLALQNDPEGKLFQEGLKKNVVLVSTSTLLATLKTVNYIWSQENQKKNVQRIVDEGSGLYDKFAGFVEELERLGKQIGTAQKTYELTWKRLKGGSGNLVKRADNLRKLGITPSKQLDQNLVEEAREEIE